MIPQDLDISSEIVRDDNSLDYLPSMILFGFNESINRNKSTYTIFNDENRFFCERSYKNDGTPYSINVTLLGNDCAYHRFYAHYIARNDKNIVFANYEHGYTVSLCYAIYGTLPVHKLIIEALDCSHFLNGVQLLNKQFKNCHFAKKDGEYDAFRCYYEKPYIEYTSDNFALHLYKRSNAYRHFDSCVIYFVDDAGKKHVLKAKHIQNMDGLLDFQDGYAPPQQLDLFANDGGYYIKVYITGNKVTVSARQANMNKFSLHAIK